MRPDGMTVLAAAEADENIGFCLDCGAEKTGVEPDARNYRCDDCGARRVFGAEEIVIQELFQGGAREDQ